MQTVLLQVTQTHILMQVTIHSQQQEQEYQLQAIQSQQRRKANLKILEVLTDLVIKNPDLRFGQLLYNTGIATHLAVYDKHNRDNDLIPRYTDIFFEESYDTLNRLTGGYKNDN